jgi:hypothetical protein
MISTIALMLPRSRRTTKIEPVIQEQVSSLQARQTQPITKPDQPQTTAPAVMQPRQQLGFAQDEIARLAQDRTQILPKSPTARPLPTAASSPVRQPQNRVSQTGSVARTPAHPPQAPARPTRTALKKPAPRLIVAEAGK